VLVSAGAGAAHEMSMYQDDIGLMLVTSASTSIGGIASVYGGETVRADVMRYLRMLSNSLVAGALATAYVVVLVLQLNPSLPLSVVRLTALVTTTGLFY